MLATMFGRAGALAPALAVSLPILALAGNSSARPAHSVRPIAARVVTLPRTDLVSGRRASGIDARSLGFPKPELIDRLSPRAASSQAHHPIRGPHTYGEAAARFGNNRGSHIHEGQDVFAPAGTPLVAVLDGRVVEAGSEGGRGNYVAIYNPRSGRTYVYLHMLEPARVPVGASVRAGQRVGSLGCTGSCFGDHLHFEVRRGRGTTAEPMDPLPLLLAWER